MIPEDDRRRLKCSFCILLCGIALVWLAAPLLFLAVKQQALPFRILMMTLPLQGAFLCAVLIPAKFFVRGRSLRELFDLKKISPPECLKTVFCGMILCIFAMLLTGSWIFFLRFLGITPEDQELIRLLSRYGSPEIYGMIFLTGGILAPVCEELAFRNIAEKYMEQYFPFPRAAMESALLFALIHCNLQTLPALTFLGFALSLLYRKSGSILTPVIAHSAFNITTLLLLLAKRVFF